MPVAVTFGIKVLQVLFSLYLETDNFSVIQSSWFHWFDLCQCFHFRWSYCHYKYISFPLRCCFYECTSQWLHSRAASSPCLYEFSFGHPGGEEPQWKYWAEQIYSSRPTVNAISCSLSYTPHNAINRKHFLFSSLLWSITGASVLSPPRLGDYDTLLAHF